MFKFFSSYVLVFSSLTHLLCCGIPIFLSFNSIFANYLIFESTVLNSEFFEVVENYLFAFTSAIILMFIFLEFYNRKINCSEEDICCNDEKHTSTKKTIRINLILSFILYVINTFLFISEKVS